MLHRNWWHCGLKVLTAACPILRSAVKVPRVAGEFCVTKVEVSFDSWHLQFYDVSG